MENILFKNSLLVGSITSITGTFIMILVNKEKKISNIIKHFLIFFIVGVIVHLILEYFNFNELCYEKKCYGDICRDELCKI